MDDRGQSSRTALTRSGVNVCVVLRVHEGARVYKQDTPVNLSVSALAMASPLNCVHRCTGTAAR